MRGKPGLWWWSELSDRQWNSSALILRAIYVKSVSQHISHYALIIIHKVLSGGLVVINDKQEFRAGLLVPGMQC